MELAAARTRAKEPRRRYVPFGGRVYELDGLKAGPVDLGEAGAAGWLPTARAAIEAKIQKYAASEIKFNLMAIVCAVPKRRDATLFARARS